MGRKSIRVNRWVVWVVLVLAILIADRLLRSRYGKERYIDPDEVRLVTIPPFWEYACEVYASKEPRLVRSLIAALNRGRSRGPSRLALNNELIIHRWQKSPIFISFGRVRERGAMMFCDRSWGRRRSPNLYRSPALQKALEAIRDSGRCEIRPPRIPPESVRRLLSYTGDAGHDLRVSSSQASRLLKLANSYLETVHATFFSLREEDEMGRAFYRGDVDPYAHLTGKTGAILVLEPPLSMHTTLWRSLEYHEFSTDTVVFWEEPSTPVRGVVAFNSREEKKRFYLFCCHPQSSGNHPWDVKSRKRWNELIRGIEESFTTPKAPVG
jgi:hypothetical protein